MTGDGEPQQEVEEDVCFEEGIASKAAFCSGMEHRRLADAMRTLKRKEKLLHLQLFHGNRAGPLSRTSPSRPLQERRAVPTRARKGPGLNGFHGMDGHALTQEQIDGSEVSTDNGAGSRGC